MFNLVLLSHNVKYSTIRILISPDIYLIDIYLSIG